MTSDWTVIHVDEPPLRFGHGQTAEHPKDGLFLYGPVESNQNPTRMDVGVIGTPEGIRRYSKWVSSIERFIPVPPLESGKKRNEANTFMWPGFQAAYGASWPSNPFSSCVIDQSELNRRILGGDRHQAIYSAVDLYEQALRKHLREEEARPAIWFAVVTDDVYKYGRPKSSIPKDIRTKITGMVSKQAAKSILKKGTLFPDERAAASVYEFELNFHNQLKARLLDTGQVIQVVRESTLARDEFDEQRRKSMQDAPSVAWNLATTSFYKAGRPPWRLASIRDGVCYVGLVFKRIERPTGRDNACCGAQMFLGSGDGVVFRGAVGPWYSETKNTYHLDEAQASKLMTMVVEAYRDIHKEYPKELFIHGRTNFDTQEWAGFQKATPASTKLAGVQIGDQNDIKLFRFGKNAVLRGTAIIASDTLGYLWTRGYIPRLATYPGREVPNPLRIEIRQGDASIRQVLNDIMALTKLNFNGAEFCDGYPVTLRFADLVGEILTAGPVKVHVPLPFKFYI